MSETAIMRCVSCGAKNRVPLDKLRNGLAPICGRCKQPLPCSSKPVTVTDATFAGEVEQSTTPVLVDLWAPWCGPCRLIAPVIEELAAEMVGLARFAKVNIDDNPETAARFRVDGIPTLLLFKEGREIDRIVGVQPKAEIARRLGKVIG